MSVRSGVTVLAAKPPEAARQPQSASLSGMFQLCALRCKSK
jgi:hypothetical protein